MDDKKLLEELEEAVWDTINRQLWDYLDGCGEYHAILEEKKLLLENHRKVAKLIDGKPTQPVTLSEEEIEALARIWELEEDRQEIERRELYYKGYEHCCRLAARIRIL